MWTKADELTLSIVMGLRRGLGARDQARWAIVRRDGGAVRLFTRRGHDWTDRYPAIVAATVNIAPSRSRWMDLSATDRQCLL
jgi:ATP-dependent DNA ligase